MSTRIAAKPLVIAQPGNQPAKTATTTRAPTQPLQQGSHTLAHATDRFDSPSLASKGDRVTTLTSKADSFESKSALPPKPGGLNQQHGSAPATIPSAPALEGRRTANEINPFDASTLPTYGRGNSVLAEVEGKGATLPLGPENAARLAAMRAEQDASIGLYTGPNHTPSPSDVAVNWDNVYDATYAGAAGGAAGGVGAGMLATAGTGGVAAPAIAYAAAQGAITGAITGYVGALAVEVIKDYKKAEAEAAAKKKPTPPPAPAKPPAGVKEDPPPPAPAADADAGVAKSSFDPMRGGRNYEANRQAYFGHADGTSIGVRGTSVSGGAANPRNTNPGRDSEEQGAPQGEAPHSVGELTMQADPMRGAKNDARAATLMSGGRVTGRHIITDPDKDASPGGGKPKGNGLT